MIKGKNAVKKLLSTSVISIAALIILLPLANILALSFSDQAEYSKNLLSFLNNFRYQNYIQAWQKARLAQYGFNTVLVCSITVAVVVVVASLCAYGLRLNKKLGFVYYYLIAGLYIPIQAVILSLFKLLKAIHLMNSPLGLALVYIGINLPLSMMIFVGFFKSIPKELEESAYVDGCNAIKAFYLIIFPLTKTVIATVTILIGLNIWRDFFIPLVLITEPAKKTLSVGLLAFVDDFSLDWTRMCAAMVMQTLPIITLFVCLQKYFVGGIVSGSVKG